MNVRTVALVGTGAVAQSLAPALCGAGVRVVGIAGRRLPAAQALALEVGAVAATDAAALPAADLYVVCVTDGAVADVARRLARGHAGAAAVHTSGGVGLDVWTGTGLRGGVLYPLQTFTRGRRVALAGVPLLLEAADDDLLAGLEALGHSLGARVVRAGSEQRLRAHVAAVFACNFANHCLALGQLVAERAGLDAELLRPLLAEMAAKAAAMPAAQAQTGPAARGDVATMARHLEALGDDVALGRLYTAMSRSIGRMAGHEGEALCPGGEG